MKNSETILPCSCCPLVFFSLILGDSNDKKKKTQVISGMGKQSPTTDGKNPNLFQETRGRVNREVQTVN